MTDLIEINVGDWCVRRSSWRFEAIGPVEKVTPKTLTAPGHWSSRASRMERECVLFVGSEAATLALVERLNSSMSLCTQEERAARQRHEERVAKLIAEASQ